MHGLLLKTDEMQGPQTLHQLCVVAITLFGFTDYITSKYTDKLRKARECVVFHITFNVNYATDFPTSG